MKPEVNIILIIVGALKIVAKKLVEKRLREIRINRKIEIMQQKEMLKTAEILRKTLEYRN